MKILPVIIVLAFATTALAGEGDEPLVKETPKPPKVKILDATEIRKTMGPWVENLQNCYRDNALDQAKASGEMRLEMIIHREGKVVTHRVVAPGVSGKKLAKCVAKVVAKLRFPRKSGFTTTAIPFYFMRTKSAKAGPMESCWSPRGCPKKVRANRAKKLEKKPEKKPAKKPAPKKKGK
jgi:hypothetical protein